MPQVSLYIRDEDWDAYRAIKDKPKWLHRSIVAETNSVKGFTTAPFKPVELNSDFKPNANPTEIHYEPVDDLP